MLSGRQTLEHDAGSRRSQTHKFRCVRRQIRPPTEYSLRSRRTRNLRLRPARCKLKILKSSEYAFMLTLSSSVRAPYYLSSIGGLIGGITGYIAMASRNSCLCARAQPQTPQIPVSCYAYLADVTTTATTTTSTRSDLLTLRAGVLHAAQSLATVLGGVAAAFVEVPVAVAVDVELALYALAFGWALWRVPQCSREERATAAAASSHATQPHSRTNSAPTNPRRGYAAAIREFLGEVWQLLCEGLWAYRRPRLGCRRAFIWATVFVLMISYTTSVETRISRFALRFTSPIAAAHGRL